jgi:hypothetical protein
MEISRFRVCKIVIRNLNQKKIQPNIISEHVLKTMDLDFM